MKKRSAMLILTLTIFILIVPSVQATDYASLKNAYIQNHPGQSIIPFPWESSTSIKVLPFNYEIPAVPANNFSIAACRDQFEVATFIITAQKDLSGITISVPNLYDGQGNSIPSSAIDVRLVKVWYQASPDGIEYTTTGSNPEFPAVGYYLTPELLLKDDSLVNVDYANKVNYLKVTINGVQQYIDISSPTATVPQTAQIRDASTLQPFSLKVNENKQIWVTVHVPGTTPSGNYSGTITVNAPSETPVMMNFSVTVLPFDLAPAPLEYGLYYTGIVTSDPLIIGDYRKTQALYAIELQNMKDHGILYPSLNPVEATYNTALSLRDAAGLPKDKIYIVDDQPGHSAYIGNAQDPAGLTTIANKVINWRNRTQAHGYTNTYFYGIDEAKGSLLSSERPAWQTVHDNIRKIFASGSNNAVDIVGDLLDVAVLFGKHNPTQITKWHSFGKKVSSYGNPQAGVENSEIYRTNYGFTLWNNGYDGAMDFAYQSGFGQSIWNDYDDPGWVEGSVTYHYRDHVFAYPTSSGVIDTLQWEGWREGVDDTRYVASLIKKDGSDASATALIAGSLLKGEDMATIREKVIEQILPQD